MPTRNVDFLQAVDKDPDCKKIMQPQTQCIHLPSPLVELKRQIPQSLGPHVGDKLADVHQGNEEIQSLSLSLAGA